MIEDLKIAKKVKINKSINLFKIYLLLKNLIKIMIMLFQSRIFKKIQTKKRKIFLKIQINH